jgi:hypothetical protein
MDRTDEAKTIMEKSRTAMKRTGRRDVPAAQRISVAAGRLVSITG